ncbi:hypothetical protein L3N51_00360 [Metallosphaera sp. J1]|uniref:hypothetical protein n=1 Tax=Metallosphaera TaxID=41980 RepID=UPI001EDCFA94|nr:hypothetical protein [Metallosphaera javensis (ex Hofmann et al. 2022)]MCG3108079.1 hypothetical protein [Metallosphaera javensis (ex Hofmann et al. 2022)]BCS94069.1 MAG: hypothetical protein MjAS7_2677 [Metallosphaera javensis (ex Sakai et al. 2022)]
MDGNEKVSVEIDGDKARFNGVIESFRVNSIHVSPPMDGFIHFYIDDKQLVISLTEEELTDVLSRVRKDEIAPSRKDFEISQIGLLYKLLVDSLEIINVSDWSLQTMFTIVNGERVRTSIGPNCEYNDCVYMAIFSGNDMIYHLKIRFSDGSFEATVFRITPTALKNELVFHMLNKSFRLY